MVSDRFKNEFTQANLWRKELKKSILVKILTRKRVKAHVVDCARHGNTLKDVISYLEPFVDFNINDITLITAMREAYGRTYRSFLEQYLGDTEAIRKSIQDTVQVYSNYEKSPGIRIVRKSARVIRKYPPA